MAYKRKNRPLTEALTTLADAQEGVDSVLVSAAEAVNAAKDTPLEGDDLKAFIKDFDAEALAEAVTDATDAIESAQGDLDSATANLLGARAETFTSGGSATALITAEIVSGDARMTDANIAAAVTKAQKGVNTDKAAYFVVDADADDNPGEAQVALALYKNAADADDNPNEFAIQAKATDAIPEGATVVGYVYEKSSGPAVYHNAAGEVVAIDTTDATDGYTVNSGSAQKTGGLVLAEDLTTAKALQTALINANSALANDIATNGDDEALLAGLRTAITEYANAGGDLDSALDNAEVTGGTPALGAGAKLSALLAAINTALDPTATDAARAAAAENLVTGLVTGDDEAVSIDDVAANKAINDALAQSFDRAELYAAADAAKTAFETTESGELLVAAETLAEAREGLNDAVTEAQEELQAAQELSDAMDAFQAEYDGAFAELEEAQQYFIDNDLALPVVLDGLMTATEENDIFLYNGEVATVSGFGLEGEDTLFFNETFTLFDATGLDIAKSGIGNSDVLEILWQQNGNNVDLYVEAQAFSGSVVGTEELTKVTLVGVNSSELQDNLDNGQLSLGDLIA